jgi:hypothetical protein
MLIVIALVMLRLLVICGRKVLHKTRRKRIVWAVNAKVLYGVSIADYGCWYHSWLYPSGYQNELLASKTLEPPGEVEFSLS